MRDSNLDVLLVESLGSIVLVRDYLQLGFGQARFSAYVWPVVHVDGVAWRVDDFGYRDTLCTFINRPVVSVEESPTSGLVIRFDHGDVTLNPSVDDLVGPEIAMLQVDETAFRDASWMVWRPGEECFSALGA